MNTYWKIGLVSFLSFFLFQPNPANAQFVFSTNNGAITITGYSGSASEIFIPANTNGYPVIAIGGSAFSSKLSINRVFLPEGVKNIGSAAFFHCENLQAISLPNSVTNLGASAFAFCGPLLAVNIPNDLLSIGNSAFSGCTNLVNLRFPAGLSLVGASAFSSCTKLREVIFEGNAPIADVTSFQYATNATAYYYLGTLGWSGTFGGIPALPRTTPAIAMTTYSNQPTLFFPVNVSANYLIQSTTNLQSSIWVNITNGIPVMGIIITNSEGAAYFRLH